MRRSEHEQLYKKYHQSLLELAQKYVNDPDTAEDIVHDAWIVIFMGVDKIEKPDKTVSWMKGIVRNLSLKHIRFQSRHKTQPLNQEADLIVDDETTRTSITYESLMSIVKSLPERYGSVFRLAIFHGKTHEEIGEMLGIAPHSSSSNLARAKKILRARLEKFLLLMIGLFISIVPIKEILPIRKYSSPNRALEQSTSFNRKLDQEDISRVHQPKDISVKRATVRQEDKSRSISPIFVGNVTFPGLTSIDIPTPLGITIKQPRIPVSKASSMGRKRSISRPFSWEEGWRVLLEGIPGSFSKNVVDRSYTIMPDFLGGTRAIDNWVDYQSYLLNNQSYLTPLQYDNLRQFAYKNSLKDIDLSEKQTDFKPVSMTISLEKRLTEKWSLRTGLGLTFMKAVSEAGDPIASHVSSTRKTWYLGIPIGLNYHIFHSDRLALYSTFGGRVDIPVVATQSMSLSFDGISGDTITFSGVRQVAPGCIWSIGVGIGLQYQISSHLQLYLEPTLQYHFQNSSGLHTWYTAHPLMMDIPVGLRFSW